MNKSISMFILQKVFLKHCELRHTVIRLIRV